MKFINFPLKYVQELDKKDKYAQKAYEIKYEFNKNYLLELKKGYREMAEFNQNYSEIGLKEDFENLIVYEKRINLVNDYED
ncbi:MAG: hypothetical protein KAH05_06730 [Clostridiales bacterium]|nr:hypothetical protein [Clostridiales bacterium]